MIIDISKLTNYSYNDQTEAELIKLFNTIFDNQCEKNPVCDDPRYDFMIGDQRIELKQTSKPIWEIEFCRADGRVSGLLLSTSDYYCVISPGYTKSELKYKMRFIKTNELKDKCYTFLQTGKTPIQFETNGNKIGSKCFPVDPKTVGDMWVGDFDLVSKSEYNTSTFKLDRYFNNNFKTNFVF